MTKAKTVQCWNCIGDGCSACGYQTALPAEVLTFEQFAPLYVDTVRRFVLTPDSPQAWATQVLASQLADMEETYPEFVARIDADFPSYL